MIRNFSDWILADGAQKKPWLMVGPDADASLVSRARNDGFMICIAELSGSIFESDVVHVVDIETMITHGAQISAKAKFVLMPDQPHVRGWSTGRSLAEFCEDLPVLAELRKQRRLLSYPLFSAIGSSRHDAILGNLGDEEVPLRLLVGAGVRQARHIGIRRKALRSTGFEAAHPVINQASGGIAALRRISGLSYGPYGLPVPARIFVGTDEAQMLGVRVLHYSIEKYSTMDVVVEPLDPGAVPVPRDAKNRSKTGFSFCRFNIPKLCGYTGRGVYVDADMQVFTDITDLWSMPLDEADLLYSLTHPRQGRQPQTSVMLLNCEKLHWNINEIIAGLDEGRYSYKQLMSELCIVPKGRHKPLLPYRWNSLEHYDPGLTSLIHYTDMPTQPWVSPKNRHGHIWYAACREALDTGFIKASELEEGIRAGHVSPELPQWLGLPAPAHYRAMAAIWVPPFHRFTKVEQPIEGRVTLGDDKRLVGWAWLPKQPQVRLRLGVFCDDIPVMTFVADGFAEILARHGKGDGHYAFDIALPADLMRGNAHRFSVRTVDDSHELPGSPLELIR